MFVFSYPKGTNTFLYTFVLVRNYNAVIAVEGGTRIFSERTRKKQVRQ